MESHGQQKFDISVPGTLDGVYDAVMKVIESGPYKKVEPSPQVRMVSFRTGMSLMTWGQRWLVQVALGIDGQSHVLATVTPRNGQQALDQARVAKLANEFFQRIATTAVAA